MTSCLTEPRGDFNKLMPQITVYEYLEADWNLDTSDLLRIERLNALLKNEILVVIVKEGQPVVKATSYVGVLKIGKITRLMGDKHLWKKFLIF